MDVGQVFGALGVLGAVVGLTFSVLLLRVLYRLARALESQFPAARRSPSTHEGD